MSAIPLHIQRRFEMGFSFHPAGCVKCAEEFWNESHTIDPNGSPHRATKAKEKPAALSRRA
jgi:hypothetical protein